MSRRVGSLRCWVLVWIATFAASPVAIAGNINDAFLAMEAGSPALVNLTSLRPEAEQPCHGEGDVAVRRGSASMMLEYWRNPQATAAKFRGDWLVTGDRGVWDGDHLRFVGREDDVITSGGYRIGPAEIEDCLLTHPAVATVGVVGKPDPVRTEIVKAYVVLKKGFSPTEGELQDWVKSRLAAYSYPREVTFLDALPMTVTGKVIRKSLKNRAIEELNEM